VLVTGAGGFLGRHFVRALAADGWAVIANVRRDDSGPRQPGVTRWVADITEVVDDPGCCPEFDAVCHAAAYIPRDVGEAEAARRCHEVNAVATLALARRALETRARLVYISAGNLYAPGTTPADESEPVYPSLRSPLYLTSKLAGEIAVEHLRQVHGLNAVSLRVSSPYGPDMPERHVVARFIAAARQRRPLVVADGGRDVLDFVDVRDVARVVVAALKSGPAGVFNVGAGVSHTVGELARAVAGAFGPGVVVDSQPAGPGPVVGFRPISIAKARSTWGFEPTALADGLRFLRDNPELARCA
jgi:UDP-glucose 4-epimerase